MGHALEILLRDAGLLGLDAKGLVVRIPSRNRTHCAVGVMGVCRLLLEQGDRISAYRAAELVTSSKVLGEARAVHC